MRMFLVKKKHSENFSDFRLTLILAMFRNQLLFHLIIIRVWDK